MTAPRFVILYATAGRSRFTCFQHCETGRGILRSTRTEAQLARWDTPEAARAWLEAAGASDGGPVPVGSPGHLTARVVELDPADLDPDVCLGALFECPDLAARRARVEARPPAPPDPVAEALAAVEARIEERARVLATRPQTVGEARADVEACERYQVAVAVRAMFSGEPPPAPEPKPKPAPKPKPREATPFLF